jgi:hypothetical protein
MLHSYGDNLACDEVSRRELVTLSVHFISPTNMRVSVV